INDEGNELANQSIDIALTDIRAKDPTVLGNVIVVQLNESDPKEALEQVCSVWDSAVKNGTSGVPDLVLDTTRSYFSTKTVNVFAAFLGIPKISARYGQRSDVKHWKDLTVNQTNYLVQIMPPVNLIPKAFRQLDCEKNVSNVAIIFDDTYVTDRMYKGLLQNISSRHIVVQAEADNSDIEQQLDRIRDLDVVNYFVLGNESTLNNYLDVADDKNLTGCRYGIGSNQAHLRSLTAQNLLPPVWLTVAFYYDVVRIGVGAMKSAIKKKSWPTSLKPRFITCEEYNGNNTPTYNFDLLGELRNATTNKLEPTFTRFHWGENNGEHHAEFNIGVNMVVINDGNSIFSDDLGLWNVDICSPLTSKTNTTLAHYTEVPTYRIVTVERPPFMEFNKETKKWEGICIDLLEEMQKYTKFNYEIYESPDGEYGSLNDKGEWNGMIKELITDNADVALGALSVTATREYAIDFTVPYYEPVGYSVITKRQLDSTSLFVFRKSMSWKVWVCSLAAFISTSLLIYIFDRWSPYSYRNDPHNKYNRHHTRIFTLRNSFWYTMSCLGPSGGGPPPKNFSGQILACSWWGFGFITIAAYSANLAASTTVGRLQPTIKTWDQVREQFKIQYAPIKDSNAYQYFFGMKAIEESFYDIWKDISLNDSLTHRERAQYAVWDYPVDDEFSRIVSHMSEYGYPESKEDALNRMFGLPPYTNESNFALIDEATELRYWALTNCSFFLFEGEFTKKPYAIAVQQGSPIKNIFDHALIELEKSYTMKRLKEKWWDNNPKRMYNCPERINRSEGLHIGNIGGIFIVLAVGNVIGVLTVILQYWWYCLRSRTRLGQLLEDGFSLDKVKPKKFKVKPMLRKITRPDKN
ncbi:GSCOCT00009832001.2-RA-CDS, partial [Cotesia congregata]